jgi:hypothetical protein
MQIRASRCRHPVNHADAMESARRRADDQELSNVQAHYEQRSGPQAFEGLGQIIIQGCTHEVGTDPV